MTTTDKINLFNPVLSLIKDDGVMNFTEQLLADADDYFFVEPASSTGKYHPKYALGYGGLARHSMAVALILNDILRGNCYEFTDRQKDLLLCAAITHDIKKYGTGKKFTVKDHPEIASSYILSEQASYGCITKEDARFIGDAVKTHMGKWGSEKPQTDAQKLVHIADCLASRKWLEVQFDNPEISVEKVEVKQDKPEDYVITFGKYDSDCKEAIKQINVRLNTWKKLIGKYYKMICVKEKHNHEYKDVYYILPYEAIDTNKTLWMLVVKCNDEYNGGVKDTVFHVDEYWNYDTYLEEISEEEFRERACESTKFVIDRRLHRLHEPKSEYRIISGEHELDN